MQLAVGLRMVKDAFRTGGSASARQALLLRAGRLIKSPGKIQHSARMAGRHMLWRHSGASRAYHRSSQSRAAARQRTPVKLVAVFS